MPKKTPTEVIRAAVDNEKLGARVRDALTDLNSDLLQELAEKFQLAGEAFDNADDALSEWEEAAGGEDKRDAREESLEALTELADALEDLPPEWESWTLPDWDAMSQSDEAHEAWQARKDAAVS